MANCPCGCRLSVADTSGKCCHCQDDPERLAAGPAPYWPSAVRLCMRCGAALDLLDGPVVERAYANARADAWQQRAEAAMALLAEVVPDIPWPLRDKAAAMLADWTPAVDAP